MKHLHCIPLYCLLIISCAASKPFKSVKYKFNETSAVNIFGKVPKNYVDIKKIKVHNETFDIEYQYVYNDSSILYISNAKTFTFPNYDNINNIDSEDSRLRLQDDDFIVETNKILIGNGKTPLPRIPYNIIFEGVDKDSLFWKDMKYGNIYIGYMGVSKRNKELFDNALNSFEVK